MQKLRTLHLYLGCVFAPMLIVVAAMACGLAITTVLGVIMALKFGRNRQIAFAGLAFGGLFPLTLGLIRLLG
jgi:TM2 domain-containing membrane protein YozV